MSNYEVTPDELVAKLTELDFFKFTPPSELERAIRNIKENWARWRSLGTDDNYHDSLIPIDRRLYHADGEDLCEKGVVDFLNDIKPILELEGVKIHSMQEETGLDSRRAYFYTVWINEREYSIFDERKGEKDCWCWSHKRTIEIINDLLDETDSLERAYGVGSHNDADIHLLTDELYHYFRSLFRTEPFKSHEMNCDCENELK